MNRPGLIWKAASARRAPAKKPMRPCSGSFIFSGHAWNALARSLWLSRRELQIVRGVFDDRTEFAIAADLNISTHTVHTHVERLHRKLAVTDRVALVVRVVEEFLKLTTLPGSVMTPICALRVAGRCPLQQPHEGTTPQEESLPAPCSKQKKSQWAPKPMATQPRPR